VSHAFELASTGPLTARFDIINVADKVSDPQHRGFLGGLAWKF
jgi:hypothetical protein